MNFFKLRIPNVRLYLLQIGVLGTFLSLLVGLFHTQVIQGPYYRRASEQNRIRLIRLEAPRGNIYDRNGLVLATSRLAYHVYAIPEDFSPEDTPILSKLLGLHEKVIRERLSEARHASFTPILLKQDVPKELAMKIEERRPELNGVFIQIGFVRTYPYGDVSAHLVGYIGKISPEEYKNLDPTVYHYNARIGRAGIERAFDSYLRGEDGGRQLEVDARGVPIRLLGEKDPRPGNDLRLTIDVKLQSGMKDLLTKHKGAILVIDLKTGGMLAAFTKPSFDPNAFVAPGRSSERLSIIGSKERKLLDRSLNGLYPPGSIFKLVTAMAALEAKVITPHTTFDCPGYFRFGPKSRAFKCWFHEGHGRMDLYMALERSCNVYFYNVGRLLGERRLAEYARKLGFGSPVELELPTAGGLVPDAEWKKNVHRDNWYPGETITFAIGQSYLLVSPLQILRLVSAIATDGTIFSPVLVWEEFKNERKDLGISVKSDTFRTIRQGMLQAVSSNRGTAQLARVNFAKLAAKTGTAQAPPGEPHAWFGGFFPFQNPEIAFVVFVERGKSGGFAAAQVGKKLVSLYHELRSPSVS
ncbi:MAG: penicillin-binding protein 2 [Candidatus Omnitrophica bacterium]|nr:penicillin-binding protein 2 [Candidatus Omnitrophota bacterium]